MEPADAGIHPEFQFREGHERYAGGDGRDGDAFGHVDGVEVVVAAGGKVPPWSRRSALRWSRLSWPIHPGIGCALSDGAIRVAGASPASDLAAAVEVGSGVGHANPLVGRLVGWALRWSLAA